MIKLTFAVLFAAVVVAAALVVMGTGTSRASLPAPVSATRTTPEDTPITVTLAAFQFDGEAGCSELTIATANATNGALGEVTPLTCASAAQLSASIDAAATTVPVITTAAFAETGSARIGSEIITYTGLTESSLTGVTRGANGTTAVAHTSGDTVSPVGNATGVVGQNINDVGGTLRITGTSLGFSASGVLQVDSEVMTYGSWAEVDTDASAGNDATDFTVQRGALNSMAQAHLAGARAFQLLASQTALSAAISNSQTTVPLASIAGLASPDGYAQVDGETVYYTGLGSDAGACGAATPPCLTGVSRASRGTAASDHDVDANVFQIASADSDTATVEFTPAPNYFSLGMTLGADIASDDTVLPITDRGFALTGAIAAAGSVAVGNEVIAYAGVGDNTEACAPVAAPCLTGASRGNGGTLATSHLASAAVFDSFFTYTAGNGSTSAPAVVGIQVAPVNDPPIADDQEVQVTPNTPQDVPIRASDMDGDSGTAPAGDCQLGFIVETQPANGTLGLPANDACESQAPNTDNTPNTDSAHIEYTPDADFTGDDSFMVSVCDNESCDDATITLHVQEPTPSPTPSPSPTPAIQRADLNCDFAVDAGDALAVLQLLAGIPQPTPAGCPPVTE